MSFADPSSPARWFLYSGIFFRWLSVYLFFANLSDQFEFTASILPEGYSEFTWAAMIGVGFSLLCTIIEMAWMRARKLNPPGMDSKRHQLNQWAVRYFLAYIFFSYGIGKILNLQFTTTITRLDQSLAEANGFWITWRFFDYSYSYKLFIGLGQIVASTLFLFRRTTTLAAMILLPVISNIVYINFAFSIEVTFFSFCYLVFTLYLLLCDFDRLNALFISNAAVPANKALQIASYNFFRKTYFIVLKAIFVFGIVLWPSFDYFKFMRGSNSSRFTGSYKVSNFIYRNNTNCPDSIRWDKIYVERWSRWGSGKTSNGKRLSFKTIRFNDANSDVQIDFRDSVRYKHITAVYEIEKDSSMTIRGLWGQDSIQLNMKRYFQSNN
jgi:uncharacterized membrane protein YphA (DoxX/SURF4 family)